LKGPLVSIQIQKGASGPSHTQYCWRDAKCQKKRSTTNALSKLSKNFWQKNSNNEYDLHCTLECQNRIDWSE
jgi:hypothetical protein